jgi:single-stranded-DNA-specific exonuclease
MSDSFADSLKLFCEKLRAKVEGGNEVAIITHFDADGIVAGSIVARALRRMGARYSVRAVSGMSSSVVEKMKSEGRDFYMLTDLGGGWSSNLRESLGDKWLMIDHHQIAEEEILTDKESSQILNPWKFGIDGGREVSAGGMAYMVASTLDSKNRDLASLAVVSAVADKQDHSQNKSFSGLNAEILKIAQSLGLISADLDIIMTGREAYPPHEAIADTPFRYINGLTWNPEACNLVLKNAGIKQKHNHDSRWRILAEFSQEEKRSIADAIAKFVAASDNRLYDILVDDLVGFVYTLLTEDKRSRLRDAREFSALLNACGRTGNAGVGIAICMGDRNAALSAGEELFRTHKMTLSNHISILFREKWRLADDGNIAFLNGEDVLDQDMLGAVSSLLSGSPSLRGRLLFVRTLTSDGMYSRFSSRKCLDCKSQLNLGIVMRDCSKALNGSGGGHSAAAGCTIPSSALEEFIVRVKAEVNDPKLVTETSS